MFLLTSPVVTIVSLLTTSLFVALLIPAQNIERIRQLCLLTSFVALFVSVLMGLSFDKAAAGYQFVSSFSFIAEFNTTFALGVDGLSYIFLVLTLFTFPFLFLAA